MKKIIIDKEIFEKFPDFKRGIIVVKDIDNAPSNKRIKRPLNAAIGERQGEEHLAHEFVAVWDKVHEEFGSNPNKFPPSIKSLLRRIQGGGGFPFINSVVALFNLVSIRHLVPCGGDDVDTIEGNLRLGLAQGDEKFIPLGGEEEESPKLGEVIYFDDQAKSVMCRRWNWRNGDFTKITENTKKIVINIDGIGPVPRALIEEARDELAVLLQEHCAAKLSVGLMEKDNMEMEIDL